MEAFSSPNCAPLANVGVDFKVNWSSILKPSPKAKFNLFTKMTEEISVMIVTPYICINVIESIMMNSKAIVLQGYGMGNVPSDNEQLMNCIKKGIQRGVYVVVMTQCTQGCVSDLY